MRYANFSFILIILSGTFFLPNQLLAQEGARLYLVPDTQTVEVGNSFTIELRVDAPEEITSIKAYLNFDPSVLSVKSIEPESEIFPYWWEKSVDQHNQTG